MSQHVKIFWNWLKHDFFGKLLFNLSLAILFWSKWATSRYIINYWCAHKYVPTYFETIFSIPPKMDEKGIVLECVFKILWALCLISYLRASFGDPGFVSSMNLKIPERVLPEKMEKKCAKCDNIWKPPRAHHCRTCQKCILRMDHHCEWIANCVGAKNQKYFILFLYYSVWYSLLVITISIMGFMFWIMEYPLDPKGQAVFKDFWGTMNRIFLAIFAVFFLLFTFDFLWEQMQGVITNQTTVETYQHLLGRPRKFIKSLEKVFGINKWTWLLPVTPDLRVNTLELLYPEIDVNSDLKKKDIYTEDEYEKLPIYNDYFMK